MKKFLLALAVMALVAAPALANEAAKSSSTGSAPAAAAKSTSTETSKSEASKAAPSASSTAASSTSSSSTSSTAATSSTSSTPNSTASAPSAAPSASSTQTAKLELPAGVKKLSGPKGEYYATASGMTIYTSAKDEAGKSNCTGECSKMWPALAATSTDKSIGSFTVINGSQWAFNGKPLYTYAQDKKSGDMNGASIPGWSVAMVSTSIPAEKPAH